MKFKRDSSINSLPDIIIRFKYGKSKALFYNKKYRKVIFYIPCRLSTDNIAERQLNRINRTLTAYLTPVLYDLR